MVRNNFLKHGIPLLVGGMLQFLLDKPGAVLITAEFHHAAK
jgi:hypothetical protein